jgi:hypothetical protein
MNLAAGITERLARKRVNGLSDESLPPSAAGTIDLHFAIRPYR